MRQNSELPQYALPGGFSPIPGEEESNGEEEPEPEEELDTSNKQEKTKTQKNKKKENPPKKNARIRRGGKARKGTYVNNKNVSSIRVFATNGAGVKNSKVDSLNAEVRSTKANIVMVQETHSTKKGKIKMANSL